LPASWLVLSESGRLILNPIFRPDGRRRFC
jgi:hypothetical protein